MGDLLGLTEQLCAVPSVSGNERALADLVEHWLRDRAPSLEVVRVGNSVVARTRFGATTRVVLGGHIDTVPANGNEQPRREGEVLHGLGTADMKGGVAVLMDLAAHLNAGNAARDVTFVLYEGEEVADEHNGLGHLFETSPALVGGDLAVMLEPTDGWIEAGCQGTVHVRATFHGTRAHSARPWMGVNAIHRAAGFLGRVVHAEPETVDVDGLAYREALQVVRIEGGVANNVVPDRCSIVVNRRFAPARSLDATIAELRDLCAEADEVEIINASPAASPGLGHPLVAELVEGAGGRVRPKLGWTDVARFAAHGIPAANFGPGDPLLAHTGDERVSAESLDACASTLRALVGMK